jgi:hypothetical protein
LSVEGFKRSSRKERLPRFIEFEIMVYGLHLQEELNFGELERGSFRSTRVSRTSWPTTLVVADLNIFSTANGSDRDRIQLESDHCWRSGEIKFQAA